MAGSVKTKTSRFGFWTIDRWELITRDIDYYAPLVKDLDLYTDHLAVMAQFFSKPVDMFPFEAKLVRPHRFYRIEEEEIAERFPGGAGQAGDEDFRAMIRFLADMFRHNIIAFVIYKKLALLAVCLLVFVCIFNPTFVSGGGCGLPLLSSSTCAALGFNAVTAAPLLGALVFLAFGVFCALNWILVSQYKELLATSALTAKSQAISRTTALSKLFGDLLHQIDQRKTALNEQKRREWPDEAGRWIVVAYWVSQRLEYIERFVQIQMWRIRRSHYFLNRIGLAVTWLLALGFSLAIAEFAAGNLGALGRLGTLRGAVLVEAVVAIAAMNGLSYGLRSWRTPLSLVKDNLGAESWHRFASLQLHQQLYMQIQSDKQSIIEADEYRHAR